MLSSGDGLRQAVTDRDLPAQGLEFGGQRWIER